MIYYLHPIHGTSIYTVFASEELVITFTSKRPTIPTSQRVYSEPNSSASTPNTSTSTPNPSAYSSSNPRASLTTAMSSSNRNNQSYSRNNLSCMAETRSILYDRDTVQQSKWSFCFVELRHTIAYAKFFGVTSRTASSIDGWDDMKIYLRLILATQQSHHNNTTIWYGCQCTTSATN